MLHTIVSHHALLMSEVSSSPVSSISKLDKERLLTSGNRLLIQLLYNSLTNLSALHTTESNTTGLAHYKHDADGLFQWMIWIKMASNQWNSK